MESFGFNLTASPFYRGFFSFTWRFLHSEGVQPYFLRNTATKPFLWWYDRHEKGDGMVMVFRREHSRCTEASYPLHLKPTASYRFTDLDTHEIRGLSAEDLKQGFSVRMPTPHESRIITYAKIADK